MIIVPALFIPIPPRISPASAVAIPPAGTIASVALAHRAKQYLKLLNISKENRPTVVASESASTASILLLVEFHFYVQASKAPYHFVVSPPLSA